MNVEYKEAVSGYIKKYSQIFEQRLGMTREDILAEVRIQIWKGLVTYDPNRKANKRTYLNNVIKNRMNDLLRRTSMKKYNSVDYYADVWSSSGIDPQYIESEETPETIFAYRELLMKVNYFLSAFDRLINGDLMEGRSLEEMENKHKVPRSEIIGSVKRIDALKKHLAG